ncbi:hypothetical protein DERP_010059 [Dermatophagoides pteronyssinus]|uniref:Uncharacterized protein n=1 Tax=Dermatophagoides pteronyssinus TaxID=6956 RepID=A0ABQ8JFK7_DERPT|nr:hypothetical protein DERP_010059 [Dermatophagoides pteronyssinus]
MLFLLCRCSRSFLFPVRSSQLQNTHQNDNKHSNFQYDHHSNNIEYYYHQQIECIESVVSCLSLAMI